MRYFTGLAVKLKNFTLLMVGGHLLLIMMAYELEVPEQKGWDIQTYDNMVDNVTNGKSTNLSSDVRGI